MDQRTTARARQRTARRTTPICYRCGGEFAHHARVPASHVAACRRANLHYVYLCPIEPCRHAPFPTWRRAAMHIRRDHAGDWQAREPSVGVARIVRMKRADYEQQRGRHLRPR